MAEVCREWDLMLLNASGQPPRKLFPWVDPALEQFEIVSRDTPEGRIYTAPDGSEYWSMTSMIKRTDEDTGWLERWRESLGPEAADLESKRCKDRGTGIHLAAELLVKNHPLKECVDAAGEYRRLYQQIANTLLTNVTKIYAVELPVFSGLMKVGGRLDLLAEWRGELALIDHKGSSSIKVQRDTVNYQHQLCGYSLCVEEMYGLKPKKLINIVATERSLTPTIMITDRKEVLSDFAQRIKRFHSSLTK